MFQFDDKISKEKLTKNSFIYQKQVGKGAFGKVYKVKLKENDKIYAMKVLSKNQLSQLKLMNQLKNEISILKKCDHQNIIKLYEAFDDQQYIYLIMELAENGSLYHLVRKSKKLSLEKSINIMKQILSAVDYLHSQKPPILHRDIKPENILIAGDMYKIADFGWSNLNDDLRNTFCGTPEYLSPEMIMGKGHNEKNDIWTLGILWYELMVGESPFKLKQNVIDRRKAQKLIEKKILEGKVDWNENFDQEIKSLIESMINPETEKRPSASELLDNAIFQKVEFKEECHVEDLVEKQRVEIERLKRENENNVNRLRHEIDKKETTMLQMYKYTKQITQKVSSFYEKNINKQKLDVTQENLLSYDNTIQKLDHIFDEFLKMKKLDVISEE